MKEISLKRDPLKTSGQIIIKTHCNLTVSNIIKVL